MLKSRYFLHISFIPFLLVGLFFLWAMQKFPTRGKFVVGIMLTVFVIANTFTLFTYANRYASGAGSKTNNPVADQVQDIAERIVLDAKQAHSK